MRRGSFRSVGARDVDRTIIPASGHSHAPRIAAHFAVLHEAPADVLLDEDFDLFAAVRACHEEFVRHAGRARTILPRITDPPWLFRCMTEPGARLPWVILFDASCAWHINANGVASTRFVREMTHTEQGHSTGVWLKAFEQRHPLPADLTDDIIQQRFGEAPGFRQAYETERDLLFGAADEPDPARCRAMAVQALAAMTARRARYFAGDNAMFGELEDLFLNMEGIANWAAYSTARRELATDADAVAFIRRAKSWSQDEGLTLFLVIDRLLPNWQGEVFARHAGLGDRPPPESHSPDRVIHLAAGCATIGA